MNRRPKRTEADWTRLLVRWLRKNGWEVRTEVPVDGIGILDVLATKERKTWAIEVKKVFGITVLRQASRWKSSLRSVAVPWRKPRNTKKADDREIARLCARSLSVGVLEIEAGGHVRETLPATLVLR